MPGQTPVCAEEAGHVGRGRRANFLEDRIGLGDHLPVDTRRRGVDLKYQRGRAAQLRTEVMRNEKPSKELPALALRFRVGLAREFIVGLIDHHAVQQDRPLGERGRGGQCAEAVDDRGFYCSGRASSRRSCGSAPGRS